MAKRTFRTLAEFQRAMFPNAVRERELAAETAREAGERVARETHEAGEADHAE